MRIKCGPPITDTRIEREDLMFLRNIVHGAPCSTPRLAARLRAIDEKLNDTRAPLSRAIDRDVNYYFDVARRRNAAMP